MEDKRKEYYIERGMSVQKYERHQPWPSDAPKCYYRHKAFK